MSQVLLEIDGEPVAAGRPRFNRKTGHTYMPTANTVHVDGIRFAWRQTGQRMFDRDQPLQMNVICWYPRPKSHYGSGKNSERLKNGAPMFKTSRPDVDNLVKLVADALNGFAFHDDAQLARVIVEKRYCGPEQTPGTAVAIRPI